MCERESVGGGGVDGEIYREGGCVDVCGEVCVCVHLDVSVAVISQER